MSAVQQIRARADTVAPRTHHHQTARGLFDPPSDLQHPRTCAAPAPRFGHFEDDECCAAGF